MNQNTGNLYGFTAIIFWSSSALLISFCTTTPTLLLIALIHFFCFATLSVKWIKNEENPLPYVKKYPFMLLFTVIGILGNNLCFIYALRLVPEVEASLINYLWPMLAVFFSALLPDHKLKVHHIIGVLLGFGGIIILIWRPEALSIHFGFGHFLALTGAFIWAIYIIGTRLFKHTPSDLIAITFFINFCIMLYVHLLFEERWTINWNDIFFIILLGVTSGTAYYAWDKGIKNGHVQLLGTAANFMPVLSTLYLVGFGVAAYTHNIAIAAFLILAGILMSSKNMVLALIEGHSENVNKSEEKVL